MWIHGHPPRQNEAMSGGKPGSVNPGPLALCAKDVSSYETSVSRKFGRMMKSTIFSKEFFWAGNSGIEKKLGPFVLTPRPEFCREFVVVVCFFSWYCLPLCYFCQIRAQRKTKQERKQNAQRRNNSHGVLILSYAKRISQKGTHCA